MGRRSNLPQPIRAGNSRGVFCQSCAQYSTAKPSRQQATQIAPPVRRFLISLSTPKTNGQILPHFSPFSGLSCAVGGIAPRLRPYAVQRLKIGFLCLSNPRGGGIAPPTLKDGQELNKVPQTRGATRQPCGLWFRSSILCALRCAPPSPHTRAKGRILPPCPLVGSP